MMMKGIQASTLHFTPMSKKESVPPTLEGLHLCVSTFLYVLYFPSFNFACIPFYTFFFFGWQRFEPQTLHILCIVPTN
jgi:hypothetical protein